MWLQQLHTFGLLAASFRPEDQVCVRRRYIRQRDTLIRDCASLGQRMQKARTQMNVQLHRVISDIPGVTGMKILRAILGGARDAQILAALRNPRIKSSRATIAHALDGDYRPEHLVALEQHRALYDTSRAMLGQCATAIERCLAGFDPQVDPAQVPLGPPKATHRRPQRNEATFDLRTHLSRIAGGDFTGIAGVDALTVQTILSEVGLDPARFPTATHFTSWLALSPNNRITGGKIKRARTRKVVTRAANAFRCAAQSAGKSHTALGGSYRRMRAKLGAPKAITATAHTLACIFYRMWTFRDAYREPGADYYEQKDRDRVLTSLTTRAAAFGYHLVPLQPVTDSVS